MVKYTYESWRKVLSVTDAQENEVTDEYNIGFVNPFRYRGYYYDYETGILLAYTKVESSKIKRSKMLINFYDKEKLKILLILL